jgi:predicted nucleic acid-binding protein
VTQAMVIDSCVCVKWVIQEEYSQNAIELLSSGLELVAPDMVLVETANALWKTVKRGLLSAEGAEARLTDLPRFFNKLLPTPDLVTEAFALGHAIDVPVYDCVYVVAGRRTGVPIVTADRKLMAKLAGTADAGNITHVADWK